MNPLWTRARFEADGPVVGHRGVPVASMIARLERGESWPDAAKALDIEPADAIAAVVADAMGDDSSLGLALIHEPPRRPLLQATTGGSAIQSLSKTAERAKALAFSAGFLQIQDFWDASHNAAQAADNLGEREFSAYWHAIAHRREPDPGNAAYWFRRVGRHPVFELVAQAARPIIEAAGYANVLGSASGWNPDTFTDFCCRAQPGSKEEALARRVQRIEMIALLDASARAVGLI